MEGRVSSGKALRRCRENHRLVSRPQTATLLTGGRFITPYGRSHRALAPSPLSGGKPSSCL
eukprot:6270-Prorocentrum_minimum.AAC.1